MNLAILLRLNPQSNGQYTVTAPWPNTYHRQEVNDKSQQGDVISVTPDGEIQTRPKGTAGAWELASLDGVLLKYNSGNGAPTYLITVTGF